MRNDDGVEPVSLVLLGIAFVAYTVFGIACLANVGEPDFLQEHLWLVADLFLGILAFLWGVVILLARYRRVQSVAVGVLIAITSIATPVGILVFGSLLARSAGGAD